MVIYVGWFMKVFLNGSLVSESWSFNSCLILPSYSLSICVLTPDLADLCTFVTDGIMDSLQSEKVALVTMLSTILCALVP